MSAENLQFLRRTAPLVRRRPYRPCRGSPRQGFYLAVETISTGGHYAMFVRPAGESLLDDCLTFAVGVVLYMTLRVWGEAGVLLWQAFYQT